MKEITENITIDDFWYREIVERCPNSIYVYDIINQRNLFANREIGITLGYTPEEIHAMGNQLFPLLLHPDDLRERIPPHHQRLMNAADGEVYHIEYRIKHQDGSWCWMISQDTPFLRDEKGNLTAYLGIIQDVTEERYTAEWEHKIVNRMPHIVYIYDMKLQANIYTNNEIWKKAGYTRNEIYAMGNTLFQRLLHPDDLARLATIQAEVAALADDEVLNVEYRVRHRYGQWIWFLDKVHIFSRDAEGFVCQYMGVMYDITRQKEIEAEQIRLKQQIIAAQQATLQNNPDYEVPTMEGVILIPFFCSIDAMQTRAIIETITHRVASLHGETVIFDVSVIPVVDEVLIQTIIQTAQSIRMLGASAMIAGVSPDELRVYGEKLSGIAVFQHIDEAIESYHHRSAH